jgi:hypothetical protein
MAVTYSCIQGGWPGTGNLNVDPALMADGTLRRGSPCIDAGNNNALPSDMLTCINGTPRFLDDPETPDTGLAGTPLGPSWTWARRNTSRSQPNACT